jgi:hypothetical protein
MSYLEIGKLDCFLSGLLAACLALALHFQSRRKVNLFRFYKLDKNSQKKKKNIKNLNDPE